jgi:hypothetical protein
VTLHSSCHIRNLKPKTKSQAESEISSRRRKLRPKTKSQAENEISSRKRNPKPKNEDQSKIQRPNFDNFRQNQNLKVLFYFCPARSTIRARFLHGCWPTYKVWIGSVRRLLYFIQGGWTKGKSACKSTYYLHFELASSVNRREEVLSHRNAI